MKDSKKPKARRSPPKVKSHSKSKSRSHSKHRAAQRKAATRKKAVVKKESNEKVGTAVRKSTMMKVYKLRAKLEFASGKRITVDEAVNHAVSKALR